MATTAFHDFGEWHSGPLCQRVAVSCHGGQGVMLLCMACGKAAELEALGGRCSLMESAELRLEAQPVG
jgi:hypothetical protein